MPMRKPSRLNCDKYVFSTSVMTAGSSKVKNA